MSRPRLFATLFAAAALLYTATAATSYVGGDHGLFAMVFAQGGYGHAPGYPVWSMLLQLFGWLPVDSAAHGSSLIAAICGGLAVAIVGLAARDFTESGAGAILAAAIAGLSGHVWYMHTMAEVFALHHVSVALLIWALAPQFPRPGAVRALVAAGAFALGVAHHHTIIFFAPAFVGALVLARRDGASWGALAGAFALPLLGLLPYGYLVWSFSGQPAAFQWGDPTSAAGLVDIFLRRDFGTLSMTVGGEQQPLLGRLGFFGIETAMDLLVFPWMLMLVAVVIGLKDSQKRTAWLTIAASLLLAGPVFALLLHRVPEGIDYLLVRKFHVTFQFAMGVPAAVGAVELARRYEREHTLGIIGIAWAVVAAATGIGGLAALQSPAPEQYARDVLSACPKDAVILGLGDHVFIGVKYLQSQGVRPDVTYVDASLLAHEWYVKQLGPELELPHTGQNINLPNIISEIAADGRPVMLSEVFHPSVQVAPIVPVMPVLELKLDGGRPPTLPEVVQANVRRLDEAQIRPAAAAPTTWAWVVQQPYANVWTNLAGALERAGMTERAAEARAQAEAFQPSTAGVAARE